ncbi:MAG: LTA synthase family protein [Saprospiraceae bacterium]
MAQPQRLHIIPFHLRFLASIFLTFMGIFTLFRLVTLAYNRPAYVWEAQHAGAIGSAFSIGFQFDLTVASYALFLPFSILSFAYLLQRTFPRLFWFARFYCTAALLICLTISAADVPYFSFFNSRLSAAAVNWKNKLQVARGILTEVHYYPVLLVVGTGVWGAGKFVSMLWRRQGEWKPQRAGIRVLITLFAAFLLLCGAWGGVVPRLPDMKSAYFSENGFINQLPLNPVHTWFDSYFSFDFHRYSQTEAREIVRRQFDVPDGGFESPLARERRFEAPPRKWHVVLILLESMSALRVGIFGDTKGLTPGLDSLARSSLFFSRCYYNGIHTNAGLYSSLYGLPVIPLQHPMYSPLALNDRFTGLPVTLKENGYHTLFFCTHPKTFDNLDVFLQNNGFETISDQRDYPESEIVNSWGVGVESLYRHALHTLDSLGSAPEGKPFFATLLSITTHPPYTIPKFTKFKPRSADPVLITYEYADWALKSFLDSCAQKPWNDQTIFVILGDHGVNAPSAYDVPLSYNHIPLIVHAPALFPNPRETNALANQTDIFPTIMGLLQIDYIQNTPGYDLLREKRPFAIFSQDQKLCVLDKDFLYVARKSGKETLFDYQNGDPADLLRQYPHRADSMRRYACAQLQIIQWMLENKQTK